MTFSTFARHVKAMVIGGYGMVCMPLNRVIIRTRPTAIVLSVGGVNSTEAPLTKTLRRMGYQVYIAAKDYPTRGAPWASGWLRVDCENNLDVLVELCKAKNPDIVCSDHRNFLLTAKSNVLKALDMEPFGDSGPLTSNDKIAFRRALDSSGAKNLKWKVLSESNTENTVFPAVVKPARGTGSRGVRKVVSGVELTDMQETLGSEAKSWIVEQFIPGRQFDVEGVVRRGKPTVLSVIEEHYHEVDGHFPSGWYVFSPPISDELRGNIINAATNVLSACGVQAGAFHCELRICAESGNIYPLDYSNRYGYPHLVSASAGLDFLELYVRSLLKEPFDEPEIEQNTVYQRYIADAAERNRFRTLIKENPSYVLSSQLLPSTVGGVPRMGNVCMKTLNFKELVTLLQNYDLIPDGFNDIYAKYST